MKKTGYFPILDSFRFIASMCVLLAHSAVFFSRLPGSEIRFAGMLKNAGYYGVIFFYVLSGFLITWLLLNEKKNTGGIAIKNFYLRRILRIWPLYYLIIVLSFVILYLFPSWDLVNSADRLVPVLLYLFFLPNIASAGGFNLVTCFHTYTIGYEEQFYLVWPLVIKHIGRHLLPLLILLFFLPVLLEMMHLYINAKTPGMNGWFLLSIRGVLTFINYSNMAAFVAGGIAAFVYLNRFSRFLRLVNGRICAVFLVAAVAVLMYSGDPGLPGYVNIVSLVFALLILNAVQTAGKGNLFLRIMARGGKISYGIYMFHPMILLFVSYFMVRFNLLFPDSPILTYILFLGVSIFIVLIVASVSFSYFERIFLRMKSRFQPGLVRAV